MPDQLLTANADTITYQMEEYKNLGLVVILHCWTVFNTSSTWHFHYYMYWSEKTTRQMPSVFSHFIMDWRIMSFELSNFRFQSDWSRRMHCALWQIKNKFRGRKKKWKFIFLKKDDDCFLIKSYLLCTQFLI